jgi:hypothetical protein
MNEWRVKMIARYLRLARPYLILLAIATVGRWLLGTAFGVPYEKGTWYFSIVTLTFYASLFYGAFSRAWLGFRVKDAAGVAMTMAVVSQLVILAATLVSYALGMSTYFTNPVALNQPEAVGLGQALGIRIGGLVVNTIVNGIVGAIGWALGGTLPTRQAS